MQAMADKAKLNWLKRFFRRPAPKVEPPVVFHEFRTTVRSYLEVPIVVEAEKGSYDATTLDISDQGLFVRTTQLPTPGVSMKARFSLPNSHSISCTLRAVWINDYNSSSVVINRPPGFGAVFTEIQDEDRKAIHEAIKLNLI